MTPATVTATGRNGNLPPAPDPAAAVSLNNIDFEIKGQLDSTAIQMEHALTGQSNILQYICLPIYCKIQSMERLKFVVQ